MREKLSEDDLRSLRRRLDYLELPPGELEQYYAQTPVIPPEQLEGMLELLRMIGEYVGESESKILFLRSINESNPVLAAREYIEIHFKSKLTVEGIARKIGMSPSYFSHIFQKETGSSPIQYLNSFRIQKASELLQETSLSISEIAFECGFHDDHAQQLASNYEELLRGGLEKFYWYNRFDGEKEYITSLIKPVKPEERLRKVECYHMLEPLFSDEPIPVDEIHKLLRKN